jgi:D-serine deaminase-like pyridoxal phosphate-dependent protein
MDNKSLQDCQMAQQTGIPINELDTPFLWADLDVMESNILYLSEYFKNVGVGWRPHTKGIKVPAIAHKLLDSGAIGVTCAKLSEAEVLVSAGIKDILIANQVVGEGKISRLARLQRHARLIVAVDSIDHAREISEIASEIGTRISVLVEVNIGMNRCGIAPGQPAVELALQISNLSGIRLLGLMGWEGHVVAILDQELKEKTCIKAIESLVKTSKMLRTIGVEIPIVSCGGSGSYTITSKVPGVTEIQAGGAVFGDVTYVKWGAGIQCSLFIRATVISRPSLSRAMIDAGFKTMNGEESMPEVVDLPGVTLSGLDAEHGYLEIENEKVQLKRNDLVDFIVGYGDSTVFLHDFLIGVRKGKVEAIWEIQGRGKIT